MKNPSSLNWIRQHRYWAGNPVIAVFIFLLLILPVGIALKIMGKDPLKKSFDPSTKSYWVKRERIISRNEDIWRQD